MSGMPARYRFQRFELVPDERRLLLDGAPAPVGARALDVLVALVENHDRVVTKRELFERVWPGLVVEENNLQVQVSTLRKLLGASAIATVAGRGYRFTLPVSGSGDAAQPPAGSSRATVARGNLPRPLGALHGREADRGAITTMLHGSALVSIVGPGGIGKTRLAIDVAQAVNAAYAGGCWLVDLAPVADARRVLPEVARVLGLPDPQAGAGAMADAMAGHGVLIVLDNCEHVLDAVAALVDVLLRGAPDMRLLITSQEPLKVDGERIYRLDGLAVPPTNDARDAGDAGAVRLFVERAQAVWPQLAADHDTLAAIVEICRRLDGIPLAIELAAARVPLLGVEGVRARLDERFRVLTGESRLVLRRHQTLRAMFDFSHGLLSEHERKVFRRLGTFIGLIAVEQAQSVCADEQLDAWEVLRCLGALVDKSLVIAVGEHPRRLRLLESARAYALEQLSAAGETQRWLARHAEATAACLRPSLDEAWRLSRDEWLARYAPELDNVRAAIDWALMHRPALAIELVGDAAKLWQEFELWPEALRYCTAAGAHVRDETPARAAGRLWYVQARANGGTSEHLMQMRDDIRRAMPLLQASGDVPVLAEALMRLATWSLFPGDEEQWAALAQLDALQPRAGEERDALNLESVRNEARGVLELRRESFAEARRHLERARDLYDALGNRAAAARAYRMVAVGHLEAGEFDAAIAVLRAVLAPLAEMRQRRSHMLGLMVLAWCLVEKGDIESAEEPLRQAASLLVAYGGTHIFNRAMGVYAAMRGRFDAAARLLGYSQSHPLDDRLPEAWTPAYRRIDARLQDLLRGVPSVQREAW